MTSHIASASTPARRTTLRRLGAALVGLSVVASVCLGNNSTAFARYDDDPQPENEDGGGSGNGPGTPRSIPAHGFSWAAPNRAASWDDAWNSFDDTGKAWAKETYDPEYAQPIWWKLYFDGCPSQDELTRSANEPGTTVNTYGWHATANGAVVNAGFSSNDCTVSLTFPAEGDYQVGLDVTTPAGVTTSYSQTVSVDDRVFVVLGDSFASGEGSPDVPSPEWTYDDPEWTDRRCHRSGKAAAALAAQKLESADPHTSITFLSFACSGATIQRQGERGVGVLGPYQGIEAPDDEVVTTVPAQVDQLDVAIGDREIDSLVFFAGLNDMRFADMLSICGVYDYCQHQEIDDKNLADPRLDKAIPTYAATIEGGYAAIYEALLLRSINYREGFNVEYPNPFTGDDGELCKAVLEDAVSGALDFIIHVIWFGADVLVPTSPGETFAIDLNEETWMTDDIYPHLLGALTDGAANIGFSHIDGVSQLFRGHGYCASEATRYINTAEDSTDSQGPWGPKWFFGVLSETMGTMHPNPAGQAAVADRLLKAVTPMFEVLDPQTGDEHYVTDEDTELWADPDQFVGTPNDGVLGNDTDPNGGTLFAFDAAVSEGTVVMDHRGAFTYTPPADFHGTVTMTYWASNGNTATPGKATIVVNPVYDAPIAIDNSFEIEGGQTNTFDIQLNDYNPDPVPVTVTLAANNARLPGGMKVSVAGGKLKVATAVVAKRQQATVSYTITDGTSSSTASVVITVTPPIVAPGVR